MEEENTEEEMPEGQKPEENQAGKKKPEAKQSSVKSFAKKLNSSMVAGIVIALIVGILLGQVALPGLGVGLVSMPSASGSEEEVDVAALQQDIEDYLNANVLEPQGVEGKIESIEPYDQDFYLINIDILKDGESLGTQELYLTKSGNAISGTVLFLDKAPAEQDTSIQEPSDQPGNVGNLSTFTDSGDQIQLEDGRPVVYLFSTTWCPHCNWVQETFDSVMKEYVDQGKIIAYHWEMDTGDNTLTEEVETSVPSDDQAVYQKFNPSGSIPTFVFGGHYYRVGNGFEGSGDTSSPDTPQSQEHLAQEEAEFRMVIEALLEEASQ